jgi:hypothetical protein
LVKAPSAAMRIDPLAVMGELSVTPPAEAIRLKLDPAFTA